LVSLLYAVLVTLILVLVIGSYGLTLIRQVQKSPPDLKTESDLSRALLTNVTAEFDEVKTGQTHLAGSISGLETEVFTAQAASSTKWR